MSGRSDHGVPPAAPADPDLAVVAAIDDPGSPW